VGPPGGCPWSYWGWNLQLVTQLQACDCVGLWLHFPMPLHSFSDLLRHQVTHSVALRRHWPTSAASARPNLYRSALTVRSRSGKDPVPVPVPDRCPNVDTATAMTQCTISDRKVTVPVVWIETHYGNCWADIAASCISTIVTRQPVHRQLHFVGSRVQPGGELRWSERQWDVFCPVSVCHPVNFVPRGRTVGLWRYPGGTAIQCVHLHCSVQCWYARHKADNVAVPPTAASKHLTLPPPSPYPQTLFLTQFVIAVLKIATIPRVLKTLSTASVSWGCH